MPPAVMRRPLACAAKAPQPSSYSAEQHRPGLDQWKRDQAQSPLVEATSTDRSPTAFVMRSAWR